MSRATSVLRNAAKTIKAEPMSADHTKYHLAPQGFWKKVHANLVVNPEISSGLPLPTEHRYPQPGSRTEQYATPATKASDVAFNPYHKRDVRRAYPQTSFITQSHLSTLLLASPALSSLPAPETKLETPQNASAISPSAEQAPTAVAASEVPALSTVLENLPAGKAFIGGGLQTASEGSALPPLPPKIGTKWQPRPGQEIPSDPNAYFPMIGYT